MLVGAPCAELEVETFRNIGGLRACRQPLHVVGKRYIDMIDAINRQDVAVAKERLSKTIQQAHRAAYCFSVRS